ncbi:hypothetical protein [Thermococcus peptonophilus]|uniref:hypothetical protein n=1 Tax=Thermococcus peptonophilus TaxID=53952 RepID=UPI0006D22DFB
MKTRTTLFLAFLLITIFFGGLALLRGPDWMLLLIGLIHGVLAVGGILRGGVKNLIRISVYIALLDFVFGIIWTIGMPSASSITLSLLAGLILAVLLDEEVRDELER